MKDCLDLIEDLAHASVIEAGNLYIPKPKIMNIRNMLSSIVDHVHRSSQNRLNNKFSINIMTDQNLCTSISTDRCFKRALYNVVNNMSQLCGVNDVIKMSVSNVKSDDYPIKSCEKSNLFISLSCPLAVDMSISDIAKSFQHYYNADIENATDDNNNLQQSLKFSLNQSLALGWFIAFNVIQNLGGHMDCSIDDNMIVIYIDIEVDISDFENIDSSALDSGLTSYTSSQNTPRFIKAYDSEVAKRHVFPSITSPTRDYSIAELFEEKKHILVVDDSPICRKVMAKSLNEMGYSTEVACDGEVKLQ